MPGHYNQHLIPSRLVYWTMRATSVRAPLLAAWFFLPCACAGEPAISPSVQDEVDASVTFAQLKLGSDRYVGRLVLLGGEVLHATRLKEGTRIEILHLPLGDDHEPRRDRMMSEGRFLAFRKEFLDPATLPPSTRVTIAGEVTGSRTLPLDESEYTYPTLAIKELKVWPAEESLPYPYYYGPYDYYPYPYGPPYRPFWRPYPYWW